MEAASVLRQLRLSVRDVTVNQVLASYVCPPKVRTVALRALGFTGIDPTARIFPGVFLGSQLLTMGKNSGMNHGCFLDLCAEVVIGENAALGYEVMLISCTHEIGTAERRCARATRERIVIGDGVWLGARVVVLPGVTIGAGCVVASGSVVSRDLPPNGLYGGNPARRIRDLEPAPAGTP